MPQYTWRGIDINGITRRGRVHARSHAALEDELFKKDIAVLSSSVKVPWSSLRRPSLYTIISFFDALAILLKAGVFLDAALTLLKNKTPHSGFQSLIDDVQCAVHDGIPFSQALGSYNHVFGSCALELIASGEQVGSLPQALCLASHYYSDQAQFTKRVKGVVLLPAITFCFFLTIAFVILTYVVPVFASMFLAAQKDVPWITRALLHVSSWCTSGTFIYYVGFMIVPIVLLKKYMQRPHIKIIKDKCILYIPFFGRLMHKQTIYQFLQTSGLLLKGGIHEMPALRTACAGLHNEHIRLQLHAVVKNVQAGRSFADALEKVPFEISAEVQAIIAVGEESGTLAQALERGAAIYRQEIERLLHIISSLVQPCLMLLLGIFITALIFAVYLPVLQLSYVIT